MSNLKPELKVLVLGNVRPEGIEILERFAHVTAIPEPVKKADVLLHVQDMDAMLHKVGYVDQEIIDQQSKLQIIARHGVGLDYLDLPVVEAAGIPVSTTQTANTNAVAEATIGLALSIMRHLNPGEAMLKREHKWARELLMGREIKGSTVGIVGYGRVGRLVAQYYAIFGANIIVYDAFPVALENCPYETAELDQLLKVSDIVSLHCPLMEETRHLINAERLALMKENSILINTSRGALVDKVALANAAKTGQIAGAAIDVFDVEPPDFSDSMFCCDNILTTPHIAAMTLQAQTAMAIGAAEEIRRVLVDNVSPSNNIFDGRKS